MSHHLVITAIGTDRPGICNQLTKVTTQSGCNIIDSRIALFGKEFAMIMLVSGDKNAITKVETLMPAIGSEHELMVILKRTAPHQAPLYTYKIEASVLSDDRRGITDAITTFFSKQHINIAELSAQTINSKQAACSNTSTTIEQTNQFVINLSGCTEETLDPIALKDDFEAYCKQLPAEGRIKITTSQSK